MSPPARGPKFGPLASLSELPWRLTGQHVRAELHWTPAAASEERRLLRRRTRP